MASGKDLLVVFLFSSPKKYNKSIATLPKYDIIKPSKILGSNDFTTNGVRNLPHFTLNCRFSPILKKSKIRIAIGIYGITKRFTAFQEGENTVIKVMFVCHGRTGRGVV